MPLVMLSSSPTVMDPASWTLGTHLLMGSDRLSLCSWTSWRITVAVNVLVILPILNLVAGVTGRFGLVEARPAARTHVPFPGTDTAATTPGTLYRCRTVVSTCWRRVWT